MRLLITVNCDGTAIPTRVSVPFPWTTKVKKMRRREGKRRKPQRVAPCMIRSKVKTPSAYQ